MKKQISCIIPAYNEGPRIANVLKAVKNHPLIDEIIVVDDGSEDDTSSVASRFDVRLIRNPKNKGKSFSVMKGIQASRHDLIMLLDADLNGLKGKDVTALLTPVLSGKADISISLRKDAWGHNIELDFVSGERVFNKGLLDDYEKLGSMPGFLVESFINKKIIEKGSRLKVVRWDNVTHTFKFKKMGYINGLMADIKMCLQIMKHIGLYNCIYYNVKMVSLKTEE